MGSLFEKTLMALIGELITLICELMALLGQLMALLGYLMAGGPGRAQCGHCVTEYI